MSGYIVAPNSITTGALSSQVTVGSSTTLKDPVPVVYTTFDGSANFTSTSGSTQTLKTSAITLPIGTYMIGTEVLITQSGGAIFTPADSVLVGFYSSGAPSIYPGMSIPLSATANASAIVNFSGMMVLTSAATFTLQLINSSSSTTNRSASWSGTWYQRIA